MDGFDNYRRERAKVTFTEDLEEVLSALNHLKSVKVLEVRKRERISVCMADLLTDLKMGNVRRLLIAIVTVGDKQNQN